MNDIDRAAEILAGSRSVVVTTGAGMSRESGIPTFRDAPSALWANYDPEALATPEGFLRDPALVWRWYDERRRMIGACAPHAGHLALARMETLYDDFILLTQNIDNLHRVAGTKNLVELHGNIFRFKCFDNHHPIDTLPEGNDVPPRCYCGSLIRPDVVWYGELLDGDDLDRSYEALATCDTVLVVGTSGIVYPAAGFPGIARQAGARVIEVNRERTPITPDAHVFVAGTAAEAVPQIVEAVRRARA